MSSELDSYPLADLTDRYQTCRSMVYVRMKALGIVPEKQGRRAFLSASQIHLMDKLHRHLEEGNIICTFPELPPTYNEETTFKAFAEFKEMEHGKEGIQKAIYERDKKEYALETGITIGELLQKASVSDLLALFKPEPSPIEQRFKYLEMLERAAEKGWLLSSTDLCELLGLNSLPSGAFQRYGFSFDRDGKNGRISAWRIQKLHQPS